MLKILTVFINCWVVLIVLLNFIAIIIMLITSPTLWDGFVRVRDTYQPFNIWNYIAEVIALSPALLAIYIRDRMREKRRNLSSENKE